MGVSVWAFGGRVWWFGGQGGEPPLPRSLLVWRVGLVVGALVCCGCSFRIANIRERTWIRLFRDAYLRSASGPLMDPLAWPGTGLSTALQAEVGAQLQQARNASLAHRPSQRSLPELGISGTADV